MEAMRPLLDREITSVVVDGGATRSRLLLELLTEAIGLPVIRSSEINASALGAAYLAGLGAGCWTFDALRAMPRRTTTVHGRRTPARGHQERQSGKPSSNEDVAKTAASRDARLSRGR